MISRYADFDISMILLSYVLRSILHPTFLFWLCCFIPNEIPAYDEHDQALRSNCHIFIGKSLHMAIFNRCVELPEGTWYNSGHARRDDTGMMRSAGNHPRPYEKNYFTVSELL